MAFSEFIEKIEKTPITKENIKKKFLESNISFDEAIDGIYKKIVDENLIEPKKNSDLTDKIKLKIKFYKKSKESEKYRIAIGYLTSIAAETLGEFHVKRAFDYIGLYLESGLITVFDSGNFCGMNMSGGCINVKSNCGAFAGFEMNGGEININGSAGTFLGHNMIKGKIHARRARSIGLKKNEKIIVDTIIEKDAITELAKNTAKDSLEDTSSLSKTETDSEIRKKERTLMEKIYGVKYDLKEEKYDKTNDMTRMMINVYGLVDTEKIAKKTEKKTEIPDVNHEYFEKIKSIFKGTAVNKRDINNIKIETEIIKNIIEKITPSTFKEEKIVGYLTSIAAERLDEKKEELHIKEKLNFIGLELEKGKIVADGAGYYTGEKMKGGEIIVSGILGSCPGYVGEEMKGGKITINCPVYGGYVGWRMQGGEICIEGDCRDAGLRMNGGKIIIKGNASSVGESMENGEIDVYKNAGIVGLRMKNGRIRCRRGEISKEKIGGEVIII